MLKLREIWMKNFRSYKDARVELGDFNLVVGKNGSGKSSLVDAFKLLKRIYSGEEYPFLEWWGYDRVVWKRKETLPITIGMRFNFYDYEIIFETTFTGVGGAFEFLKEVLEVKGVVSFERVGDKLTIKHDAEFLDGVWDTLVETFYDDIEGYILQNLLLVFSEEDEVSIWKRLKKENIINQTVRIKFGDKSFLEYLNNMIKRYVSAKLKDNKFSLVAWRVEEFDGNLVDVSCVLTVEPLIKTENRMMTPIIDELIFKLQNYFGSTFTFKPLNVQSIKENVVRPKKESQLNEDASNLQVVLHNLFLREGGKLPERIENAVGSIFPNIRIAFDLTEDGRIFMKVYENNLELDPPMIPDGLYKILAIMAAIELNPGILVIDELENSIHPEAIWRIVDELRNAGCTVIATTHSPAVVDISKPEELIVVEKDEEGESHLRKVEDPAKIKEKLDELGITLSEGWLFGKL
jgi:predicted ATPase